MAEISFRALEASQGPGGSYRQDLVQRTTADLPPGDLLVRVRYSSLNFKDALAAVGRRGVARVYPLTPGIDSVGEVVESRVPELIPGDRVLACGNELGVSIPGGFGQFVRIPAAWAMKLPAGLTERESMIIGTAGFTAALSLHTLQRAGADPARGPVLVTGASGGVGSFSVALLAAEGFSVTAATGKTEEQEYLLSLGAREVISRADSADDPGKALLKERWAAVIDTVGGSILAGAVKATMYGGAVAACGNAASPELPVTVFPFILRGVQLLGIESGRCPPALKRDLWARLGGSWKPRGLERIGGECSLDELPAKIEAILQGNVRGRVVVNLG